MTARTVDFFPGRVPLMGLPRSSTSNSSSLGNSRPVIAKIKGVSRNLFGTPDRDEMRKLYQEEAERQHSYVLNRYNFDTKTSKSKYDKEQQPTEKGHVNQTTTYPAIQPTQFPDLVQQELVQHEQRLHDEEHNLNRYSFKINTPNEKIPNTKSCSKVSHRSLVRTLSPSPALERQKPYSRQPLLKESFNIRKNKACVTKNVQQCNEDIISLDNNQISHQNLEVMHLPQPINSQLPTKLCEVENNVNESSSNNDVIDRE